jgi:hypothetical protein
MSQLTKLLDETSKSIVKIRDELRRLIQCYSKELDKTSLDDLKLRLFYDEMYADMTSIHNRYRAVETHLKTEHNGETQ